VAKILLVEDNEMNRDMLSRRLERRGYEVVVAVDGAEAIEKAVEAGCDDFDIKPVDLARLLGKIEALLARNPIP
jgi:CheY-like chemotaxis protein